MASSSSGPTVPRATAEQVRQAADVVLRVCGEFGVAVDVEALKSRDPEIPGTDHVEILARIQDQLPARQFMKLISAVAERLRERGLHEPDAAILPHLIPDW